VRKRAHQLRVETGEELHKKYPNRKSILWPWETENWPKIEKILSSTITTPEELEVLNFGGHLIIKERLYRNSER
jgi:hypothetical protein